MQHVARLVAAMVWLLLVGEIFAPLMAQDPAPLNRSNPWRELAKLPVTASVVGGYEVFVVDETGKPAQADVYVYERKFQPTLGASARSLLLHFHAHGPAMHAVSSGTRYHTDERGVVRVKKSDTADCFAMAQGTLSKFAKLHPRTVLHAHPFVKVLVEVVDVDGRPVANLPLEVDGRNGVMPVSASYTDRLGRCEFRLFRHVLDRDDGQWKVVAGVVAKHPVELPVPDDYFDSPPSLLRLQLPPVGSVLVHVDSGARKLTPYYQASLVWKPQVGTFATPRPWPALQWTAEGALFPAVALGTEVVAEVFGGAEHFQQIRAGPTVQGQRLRIDLDARPKFLTLTGQLLGEDGQALANTDCYGYMSSEGGARTLEVRTDSRGAFKLKLPVMDAKEGKARIQLGPSDRPSERVGRDAQFPANKHVARAVWLRTVPANGVVDLGIVAIKLAPPLLRGVVLDTDGNAVAGLVVEASTGWLRPGDYRATTAKDGSFAFYDALPRTGNVSFQFVSSLWGETLQNHGTIGKPVELRVRATCNLLATLEEPEMAAALKLELHNGQRVVSRVHGRGRFMFRNIRPGMYAVHGYLAGQRVLTIENVHAAHVANNEPAMLQGVKWLHNVQDATVKLSDPTGVPVLAAATIVEGKHATRRIEAKDGGLIRVPFIDGQRVRFVHRHYRTREVALSEGTQDLVLKPRAKLRVSLPDGLMLPAGARLVVGDTEGTTILNRRGATVIRPDGSSDIPLDLVMFDTQGRPRNLHSQTVRLREDAQPVDVTLTIDKKVVEAAEAIADEVRRVRGG